MPPSTRRFAAQPVSIRGATSVKSQPSVAGSPGVVESPIRRRTAFLVPAGLSLLLSFSCNRSSAEQTASPTTSDGGSQLEGCPRPIAVGGAGAGVAADAAPTQEQADGGGMSVNPSLTDPLPISTDGGARDVGSGGSSFADGGVRNTGGAVAEPTRAIDASVPEPSCDMPVASDPLTLDFEPIRLDPDVAQLTDFVFLPDGSLLLTGKDGRLFHLAFDGEEATLLASVQLEGVYDALDCGLISIALDPGFAQNQLFYLGHCTDIEESGVFRYRFEAELGEVVASKTEVVLARLVGAERPWHNVGALNFDEDGNLYVPFGDKVDSRQAQALDTNLGALLRIIPNRDPDGSGFAPAPGNPFSGDPERSDAIYAYGLRSPWRGSLDSQGRYWVGDVGSSEIEEINVVTAPGQNLAWPDAEGPCERCDGIDPVTFWGRSFDHPYFMDDPETLPIMARVVWVGPEYRARSVDRYQGRLTGSVLFGEFCTGFVRAATLGDAGTLSSDRPLGHLLTPTAWREGPDGYLYVTTFGRCQTDVDRPSDRPSQLLRAVPADPTPE